MRLNIFDFSGFLRLRFVNTLRHDGYALTRVASEVLRLARGAGYASDAVLENRSE